MLKNIRGPLLIATGEAIPLRGLEGVPGLPGAPQDDPGVPPYILQHLPPKTRVCLLYCFVLSPLTLLGAVPHHHLALSVKELTYSSN